MSTLEVFRLTRLALKHWQVHQPTLYRDLQKAGQLSQHAQQAARRTLSDLDSLTASGLTRQEAWQVVRERYLLLPPESAPKSHSDLTDIAQDLMAIFREAENE